MISFPTRYKLKDQEKYDLDKAAEKYNLAAQKVFKFIPSGYYRHFYLLNLHLMKRKPIACILHIEELGDMVKVEKIEGGLLITINLL